MNFCAKSPISEEKQHDFLLKDVEIVNYITNISERKTISICRFCSKGLLSDYANTSEDNIIDFLDKLSLSEKDIMNANILNEPHIHEWSRYIGQCGDKYHIRCKDSECKYIIRISTSDSTS